MEEKKTEVGGYAKVFVWDYFAFRGLVWYLSLKERIQEGGMRE